MISIILPLVVAVAANPLQCLDQSGVSYYHSGNREFSSLIKGWNLEASGPTEKKVAVLVRAFTDEDVIDALRCAQLHDMSVVPRSGRNGFGIWTDEDFLPNTMILDVGEMNHVELQGSVLSFGPGTSAQVQAIRLVNGGATAAIAHCSRLGAGYILGGGVGLWHNFYGLAIDQLRSASIILFNGTRLEVSEELHPDLFWALRGAGAGNFGIVTRFDVNVFPPMEDLWRRDFFYYEGSELQALRDLRFVQTDARHTMDVHLTAEGLKITVLYRTGAVFTVPEGFKPPMPAERMNWDTHYDLLFTPSGFTRKGRMRSHSWFVGGNITYPMRTPMLRDIVTVVKSGRINGLVLKLRMLGPMVHKVSPTATAFVHRTDQALASLRIDRGPRDDPITPLEASILDNLFSMIWPTTTMRSYQSYPDTTLKGWARAFFGRNLERLKLVQLAYDPENRFSGPQTLARVDPNTILSTHRHTEMCSCLRNKMLQQPTDSPSLTTTSEMGDEL